MEVCEGYKVVEKFDDDDDDDDDDDGDDYGGDE